MNQRTFALRGIDGANPVGFLAAVGTLVVLAQGGHAEARLWWQESITWTPVLAGVPAADEELLADLVADALTGATVSAENERRRAAAERAMQAARRERDRMAKNLRSARRDPRGRHAVSESALLPFEQAYGETRRQWLEALRRAVPRPELALGRRIDCTPDEYRGHAASMLRRATHAARDSLDLLAAFGSDACRRPHDVIEPTPFCFITGSGHQEFLDTVRALIDTVTPQRVRETLFQPWVYRDTGLSMRWDPAEDKRYALLDADPGEAGVRTVWMANLLAYRALALFPAVPTVRGLVTTGWNQVGGSRAFSWPLWHCPASLDSVRSLLQLAELAHRHPDMTSLRARGIAAVYRSQRIDIGVGGKQKVNFTQARRV
jgi:hypothetical protein